MADHPFRILALSGGGARGVFQAAFLANLERELGRPLVEVFDLIAGTSTGAIVALGLAARVPASEVMTLYLEHGERVFAKQRIAAAMRPGARFDQEYLRATLKDILGSTPLGALETEILVAASNINTFRGRIFTRNDADLLAVDVALASAAAPTYFPPVRPAGTQASYMDGGLWSNDPSLLAVLYAYRAHAIALEDMRLVSIGTGRRPGGMTPATIEGLRTVSLGTVEFILEFMMTTQQWFAESYTQRLLTTDRIVRVDSQLKDPIRLHDAKASIEILPALAELEFDRLCPDITRLIADEATPAAPSVTWKVPNTVLEAVAAERISGLFPSRDYYSSHREGRGSIDNYIDLAQTSLTMASITLTTGISMDDVLRKFGELVLTRDPPVAICVSLLDPTRRYLMQSVAPVLDNTPTQLAERIRDSLDRIQAFRASLPEAHRDQFSLRVHRAIPNASAIMVDHRLPTGRIQLETKPYKVGMRSSFGLEVRSGSSFYSTLVRSYEQLLEDGQQLVGPGS